MVAGDFRLLCLLLLAALGVLGVAYGVLRAFGYDARRALTAAEWGMALKIAATALMLYTLLLNSIYAGLPVEKFIYGRF
jgi:hypothetical protein